MVDVTRKDGVESRLVPSFANCFGGWVVYAACPCFEQCFIVLLIALRKLVVGLATQVGLPAICYLLRRCVLPGTYSQSQSHNWTRM